MTKNYVFFTFLSFSHISFFYTYLHNLKTLLDLLSWNFGHDMPWEVFYKRCAAFFEKLIFWPLLAQNARFLAIFA